MGNDEHGELNRKTLWHIITSLDSSITESELEMCWTSACANVNNTVNIESFVDWVLRPPGVKAKLAAEEDAAATRSSQFPELAAVAIDTVPVTHGPLIGEVTETEATIWVRGSRAGKVSLEWWPSDEPPVRGVAVLDLAGEEADFTCKFRLVGLKPRTPYDLMVGNQRCGKFRTPPSKRGERDRGITFVFGSCLGGQGYGPDDGVGYSIFSQILKLKPEFIHINGDSIYADDKIEAVSTYPWNKGRKNEVGESGDQAPATEISGFRQRYRFHLEDPHVAKFFAHTPVFNTWDDHEIVDDWGAERLVSRGQETLLRDGTQAFFEYWPLAGPSEEPTRVYRRASWGPHCELFILDCRSYRSVHEVAEPGGTPMMSTILGKAQHEWLLSALSDSMATWKFICTSVPLVYPTGWPRPEETGFDGWSTGGRGGTEAELMSILRHIQDEGMQNVLFISGDVHFPFCISYDPFNNGRPLTWELGCTPFCALCLPCPASVSAPHLNPTVLFARGEFAADLCNFGHVSIEDEGRLTFTIFDAQVDPLYSVELEPGSVGPLPNAATPSAGT